MAIHHHATSQPLDTSRQGHTGSAYYPFIYRVLLPVLACTAFKGSYPVRFPRKGGSAAKWNH